MSNKKKPEKVFKSFEEFKEFYYPTSSNDKINLSPDETIKKIIKDTTKKPRRKPKTKTNEENNNK